MKVVRRLYDWVLSWADHPYGLVALAVISFAESSFFPIPPDVLLIALAIGNPQGAWKIALVCTLASAAGGAAGYGIGVFGMELVGDRIIDLYGLRGKFAALQGNFAEYGVAYVGIAGFTPIPYKLFTITAGVVRLDFMSFLVTSFFARGARFFLVAGLIRVFGEQVRDFIDKWFNLLTIAFTVLLIGGFYVAKVLLK